MSQAKQDIPGRKPDAEGDHDDGAIGTLAQGGIGPFVTWTAHRLAEDRALLRTSRRHRKGLAPLPATSPAVHPHSFDPRLFDPRLFDPHRAERIAGWRWLRIWAPSRLAWWIAVLFMIGAAHFALASAVASAAAWPQSHLAVVLSPDGIAWTYFLGSLFFTTAAYLQWLEAVNGALNRVGPDGRRGPWRYWGWAPRSLAYWAGAIQFAGTLLFNMNTGDALILQLAAQKADWTAQDLLVWVPNMAGSVCFLTASYCAVMEDSHRLWSFRPRRLAWWIVMINLAGSLLFQASALASFALPDAQTLALEAANITTLGGALCFFFAAYLLIPELFEKE
ncbi:MAG: hypothetical protein AAF530_01425 [Pseudomonadota bacterium]